MRRTWFDRNLFRDGFRQLTVSGLICGLVLVLQAVLIPVGQVLSAQETHSVGVAAVDYWGLNPMSAMIFCCFAPLMALYLFRFLSHRRDCDFYHAIPQTRTCLYSSFTLAVLAWAYILQWGSTLVGILVHLIFRKYFYLDMGNILMTGVQISACILFVIGAVMLAVTLTGNALTNLVVSLLIIFFPRLLMLVVRKCVGSSLTIVNSNYLSFLGNRWNVVTGLVFSMFDTSLLKDPLAALYTAALGVIYLIFGGFMFNRRRSEAAGEASIHPALQTIFRLLPAAVFCLIPDVQIYNNVLEGHAFRVTEWYWLGILFLIGIFIYFMYELVSTRKLKNLPKAAPGLVFLVGFNLLVIFGMFGMRRSLLNFHPAADQINSVRIVGSRLYINSPDGGDSVPGYFSSQLAKVELTDEEIRELLSLRLQESIAFDESAKHEDQDNNYQLQEVAFNCGGKETYRTLHLMNTDIKRIGEVLYRDERASKIYMTLPEAGDPRTQLNLVQSYGEYREVPGEMAAAVYEALLQDVQNMGFEKWFDLCNRNDNYGDFTLYVRTTEDGEHRGLAIPLNRLTPLALEAALTESWKREAVDREAMRENLARMQQDLKDGAVMEYYTGLLTWTDGEGNQSFQDLNLTDESIGQTVQELLAAQAEAPIDCSKGYLVISLSVEYRPDAIAGDGAENEISSREDFTSYYGGILLAMPEDMASYAERLGMDAPKAQ